MLISPPRPWSVIEDGALIRSATSLSDLATRASSARPGAWLRRLRTVDPFCMPPDHPIIQLGDCAQAARQALSGRQFRLTGRQVEVIVSVYETGLHAGYCGIAAPGSQNSAEGLESIDLTDVSSIAWRHGKAVVEWWRAYDKLLAALFDLPVRSGRASSRRLGSHQPC